ncbi:helix-turn-helix domain-containing protein [Paracoccus sp. (in: a-proteobacteria)]|uniref:helix-turn-helix domain-containing protein n=1 Tax=Paracoccus sp. TaxID=267 RepID=UPI0026E0238E|nr:helix-turn-helix domain-containing protein [Paracoccus sp. (in: a-proteobacteria)]MDO5648713.1 helix-turn-helix domain-containing protein [Paracoccus sp. (in: a-proteobacteria)]
MLQSIILSDPYSKILHTVATLKLSHIKLNEIIRSKTLRLIELSIIIAPMLTHNNTNPVGTGEEAEMNGIPIGWHPARIRAEVVLRGGNFSRIAREAGIDHTCISKALRVPCYVGEQALAKFLKVPAYTIWPSRYDADGMPRHARTRAQLIANKLTVKATKYAKGA